MSLRPQQPLPPVPNDTARLARAAFRRGNPYMLLRDRLRAVFDDMGFADLWHERYDCRVEVMRLPETGPKRDAYFIQVGADGFLVLDALDRAGAPPDTVALTAV